MSAEVVPLPHRRADPARFAATQHALFAGRRLHVGRSSVVHEVAYAEWLDELTLPVPACRQGFAGLGAHGELRPTRWPVTCRRCRRLRGDDSGNEHQEQPALFAL